MDSPSSPSQPGSHPQPGLKPRSFFQSGCFISVVVILLLLTVGLVIFYFGVWRVPTRDEEVGKIREQAEARLDAARLIPEKENGWFTLLEAAEKVQMNVPDSKGNPVELSPIYEKGINTENAVLYEKFVKANQEAVGLVEKAMEKKECRPVWDFRKTSGGIFPINSLQFRDLVHLLILMGDEEAKKGDCGQAARRYMQAMFIGEASARAESANELLYGSVMGGEVSAHLKTFLNEYPCNSQTYEQDLPNYHSKFVGESQKHAIRGRDPSTSLRMINSRRFSPKMHKSCYEYITRQMYEFEKKLPNFRQMMEYELINNHYTLNQTRISIVQGSRMKPHEEMFLRREYSILDNMILGILDVEALDYQTALDTIDSQGKKIPPLSIMPEMMVKSYYKRFQYYTRYRVERRGLLILAALHWYREDTGHYPDSLSQLVPKYLPELPPDNYSRNRQFHYVKTTGSRNKADGMKKGANKDTKKGNKKVVQVKTGKETNSETILLYSIGDDQKDDGGKRVSRYMGDPGDVVFSGKNLGE